MKKMKFDQQVYNLMTGSHVVHEVYKMLDEMFNRSSEEEFIKAYEAIRPEIETLAKAMHIEF